MHYAKGETANDHKYLYIDGNGNYIYERKNQRPIGRRSSVTGSATVFKQNKGIAGKSKILSNNKIQGRFDSRSTLGKAKSSYVNNKNKVLNVFSIGLNNAFKFTEETKKKAKNKVKKLKSQFDSVFKKIIR